jgi:hypothetical protein
VISLRASIASRSTTPEAVLSQWPISGRVIAAAARPMTAYLSVGAPALTVNSRQPGAAFVHVESAVQFARHHTEEGA